MKVSHGMTIALMVFISLFRMHICQMNAQAKVDYRSGEKDDYRRSSLCLMLVTHEGDKYAQAIEEQFKEMPLPSRYNSLNVDIRVISTREKATDKRVTQWLKDRHVAKELVGKWFNRSYSGVMNMNRIHEWGGYNASFADLKRAQATERGTALLSDEGSELIKNTFVMVCDISYFDRSKTGDWLSTLAMAGALYLDGTAQQQAKKGNTNNASTYSNLALAAAATSEAAADIAGFSVNVVARLYRLKWDDELCDNLYSQYWVDSKTPILEAQSRKKAFDQDNSSYQLEYLGSYRSRSAKTVSKSANNLDLVIREICADAVDNSINSLSKMFPVFKTKTPFYCEDNDIYAYIGTKEGVNNKSKFEVLETKKTADGIKYNKVAQVSPRQVWNNTGIFIAQDSLEQQYKGTRFAQTKGKKDICDQGYLLREMGKIGYQFRTHTFTAEYMFEPLKIGKSKLDDIRDEYEGSNRYNYSYTTGYGLTESRVLFTKKPKSTWTHGFSLGWNVNFNSEWTWNVVNFKYQTGDNGTSLWGANMGFIYRFYIFGKGGRNSIFIWPTFGYAELRQDCSYTALTYSHIYKKSSLTGKIEHVEDGYTVNKQESSPLKQNGFDWRLKVGVNITPHIFAALSYSRFSAGPGLVAGFNF